VRTYTDITDRKKSEERIAHLARHDAVTALPNRVLFRERLEQALANRRRHGGSVALLCLDLDQFKAVNDTLGHPVGDALLKLVADRIKGDLRDEDTVARLGGDEFAILQIGGAQPRDSAALARRLIDSVNRPYRIGEDAIDVGVSIGIVAVAEDACDPDQLFKHADLALYRAKADGRGTFRFFEARMDAEVRARRQLEKDLRESLTRGDFELHYQSLHGAADQAAVGFEALLRWRHPTRGLVQPGDFISVAEETRLIVPLGEWVLRQACHDAAKWPGHLRLAINVSAAQFRATNLVQAVMSALAASGLAANRLEIEITETILMQGNEALRTLHQLRELGVRMIMDDFGTGYSSLSYLHSFPFDRMKIDRSFVRHMIEKPDSAAIVRAIVQLGASLGISTIAEGVETPEQFQALRQMGCGEVQGYLFSRPEPIADALKRLPPRLAVAAA
jgi:diguanylate cyclase (GGDEF)-like protein